MDFDPHTLHQILGRIQKQLKCPQCGKHVPVDFGAVRLTGDDFMLLQLKCEACNAFIVLHASLQQAKDAKKDKAHDADHGCNISSVLCKGEEEVKDLRRNLKEAGGSFEKLFKAPIAPKEGPTII